LYSHTKILWNGRLDVIKDLNKQFNESIYLSAQDNYYNMWQKTKMVKSLKSTKYHMICLITLFEDETLIITNINIIEFKDWQIMY
jgi:hypothetical protein